MINYKVFKNKQATAEALAEDLAKLLMERGDVKTSIALSGGSTPFVMFDVIAEKYAEQINWKNIHFFWVDERCVPPESDESNYKNTHKSLFSKIDIQAGNIHRVLGENNPQDEAIRYSQEIDAHVGVANGKPQFDIVLLGMGDDGHTASIFPPQLELLEAAENAVVGQNPYSKQNRISLSGTVINNAARIYFLVTGENKAQILKQIVAQESDYLKYPAAHISTEYALWYLDKDAVLF